MDSHFIPIEIFVRRWPRKKFNLIHRVNFTARINSKYLTIFTSCVKAYSVTLYLLSFSCFILFSFQSVNSSFCSLHSFNFLGGFVFFFHSSHLSTVTQGWKVKKLGSLFVERFLPWLIQGLLKLIFLAFLRFFVPLGFRAVTISSTKSLVSIEISGTWWMLSSAISKRTITFSNLG